MKENIIASYTNGNYQVNLYSHGTKERKCIYNEFAPKFPESVDLKITNKCDLGCKYCHEKSVLSGEHGDIDTIIESLSFLPAGVEIAIGGGNPFEHPQLTTLLKALKKQGLIANITINASHLKKYGNELKSLYYAKLVHGIGISYNGSRWFNTYDTVYHMIAGIHTFEQIKFVLNNHNKVLILGYKQIGRGKNFYNIEIKNNIERLKHSLWEIMGKGILSFDNLAIKQLSVKDHFTKDGWDRFYMGDDGKFTMYYDGVKQEYAESSTSLECIKNASNVYSAFKMLQACVYA